MNIKSILDRPIPLQATALVRKQSYRNYPLRESEDGPLVAISQYGIAGQSYYSRPNNATGDPLPEADPNIYIRQPLAERLADINRSLKHSALVTELFRRPVELYIDEGLRTQTVQKKLYQQVFPRLITKQFPDFTAAQVIARRNQMIAKPSSITSPSPHATGAAVDIKLRYVHPNKGFVAHDFISMGHGKAHMGPNAGPDYYELLPRLTKADRIARRNRRIFYWVMRGALLGTDTGLVVNPTEVWHWSYGDQMWAALTEAPCAFYGSVQERRVR